MLRVRGEPAQRLDAYVDLLTERISQDVRDRAAAWERNGVPAPPVTEMADLLTARLPVAEPHALDASVGPFYDAQGVTTLLGGISRQAVAARRRTGSILALRTADRQWVYPTFQFAGTDVDPALVPLIRIFQDVDAWATALWFVMENPDLGGLSPVDWSRDNRPAETLMSSARATVVEWR